MPITQDRLYAMTRAARVFYDAFYYVRNTALNELGLVESRKLTPSQALDNIIRAIHHTVFDPQLLMNVGAEERHHSLTRRKNERAATRQTKRRRDQGITPRVSRNAVEDDFIVEEGDEAYIAPSLDTINAASADFPPTINLELDDEPPHHE